MKFKKYVFISLICLLFLFLSIPVSAFKTEVLIFDEAALFNKSQYSELFSKVSPFIYHADHLVILTIPKDNPNIFSSVEQFCSKNNLSDNCIIIVIDTISNQYNLFCTGRPYQLLVDEEINSVLAVSSPFFKEGNYVDGIVAMVPQMERFILNDSTRDVSFNGMFYLLMIISCNIFISAILSSIFRSQYNKIYKKPHLYDFESKEVIISRENVFHLKTKEKVLHNFFTSGKPQNSKNSNDT